MHLEVRSTWATYVIQTPGGTRISEQPDMAAARNALVPSVLLSATAPKSATEQPLAAPSLLLVALLLVTSAAAATASPSTPPRSTMTHSPACYCYT